MLNKQLWLDKQPWTAATCRSFWRSPSGGNSFDGVEMLVDGTHFSVPGFGANCFVPSNTHCGNGLPESYDKSQQSKAAQLRVKVSSSA